MTAFSCCILLSLILQSAKSLHVPSFKQQLQWQSGRRKPLSLVIPVHRTYKPHRYNILSATKRSSSSSISENEIPINNEVVPKSKVKDKLSTDKIDKYEEIEIDKLSTDKYEIDKYEIDKFELMNQTEAIPLGELTQDYKRDMLTVMRQLSSMGRRQDDIIGSTKQRRSDAQIVERMLDRLLKEYQYSIEFTDNVKSISSEYNLAIKAWANANVPGSAKNAARILKRLKIANINNVSGDEKASAKADIYSFAYCYAAWYKEATFGNGSAMRKAESVLQSMKQVLMKKEDTDIYLSHSYQNMVEDVNSLLVMWSNTNIKLPGLSQQFLRFIEVESKGTGGNWLNTRSYNLVINAWSRSGSNEAVAKSEALLKSMEESSTVSPDLLSYSGVISSISKSKRESDIKKAEDVLQRVSKSKSIQPDSIIYNMVMNIYSKRGHGSVEKCEMLLKRMETLATQGNEHVAPDIRTYNLLLTAYSNEMGANEAEKILHRIEKHKSINPNVITYTTCMDSYSKKGDAHNALRILSLMEKTFKDGNLDCKPTRRAYVSALNSLANSGRGDAGTRGEELVRTMERMANDGYPELQPDTTVYNVLINCHKNSAARAEKVLYRMGKRDVVSYSSVINIHSKSNGGIKAAKRAQKLLDEMQNEQIVPNAYTYNSAITAFASSGSRGAAQRAEGLLNKMEDAGVLPSAKVYTSVITAWAKSNEPGSALRAEVLLKLMWQMYKRDGNKDVKPNAHTFTSVISTWSKSRDKQAGQRAEALLDNMIKLYKRGDSELKPNVVTFTSVIQAYARIGGRDAADAANGILRQMEALGVAPNLQTYNVLISLWGNSQQIGAGLKAESILTKLEDEYQNGNKDMKPTVVSYTSVINAWAKSSCFGKAERANDILKRMKSNDCQPNEFSYTAVINSCATTYNEEEKQDAFKIAYRCFKELSEAEHLHPNHVTYSTFMRAIGKLMPDGEKKDSMMSIAFRLCVRDAMCDSNCLFHLRQAAPPELVQDLLGCSDESEAARLTFEELPSQWTRNVAKQSSRPRNKIK